MSSRGVEIDHVETDAIFAHDAQFRHGAEHRIVERLESRDRFVVPAEKLDEFVAPQHAVRQMNLASGYRSRSSRRSVALFEKEREATATVTGGG